jgi:hypothetical protein
MALNNFYEKETNEFTGTVKVDGTAQDITGDSITFYLMDKPNGTAKITKNADVSLGSGQYTVFMSKSDTAITPGIYFYEIWWVLSNGEEYILEQGKVKVMDSYYKTEN